MWTAENRRRYDRSQLRYPSDLTDDEWGHVAPLIPPAKRRRQQALGRRARSDERDHVCSEHGMPVASGPEGPAAAQHAVRLSRFVELRRNARSHPSRAVSGVPGARRTRSQPDRRHHR